MGAGGTITANGMTAIIISAYDVTVRDLHIDGDNTASTIGVELRSDRSIVDACSIDNFDYGIATTLSYQSVACTIGNCDIRFCNTALISLINGWEYTLAPGIVGWGQWQDNISAIAGDGATVTVDTATDHDCLTGQYVQIDGTVNYDGYYTITRVDANTFTFASVAVGAEVVGTVDAFTEYALYFRDFDATYTWGVDLMICKYGLYMAPGVGAGTEPCNFNFFYGCLFDTCKVDAVHIHPGDDGQMIGNKFDSCWFAADDLAGCCVRVESAGDAQYFGHLAFYDCWYRNAGKDGLSVDSTDLVTLVVHGGMVSGVNDSGGAYSGFHINASGCKLSIKDVEFGDFDLTGTTPKYHLYIENAAIGRVADCWGDSNYGTSAYLDSSGNVAQLGNLWE